VQHYMIKFVSDMSQIGGFIRVVGLNTVFRLLTDFVCLYTYEFSLSLCKIVRSSVILLLPLFKVQSFTFTLT
jgi:hypothetical protein